ncbi:hypothetical protein [uncultured Oscillibacter sp.]|uniref:hypothetical protein n=1 Tax=uncultured Oscillibacter sp. TaxID=876091 RepID=UPI0025ED4AFD|nr:hypothetical protein [uncultured Oscillibacter sp.]
MMNTCIFHSVNSGLYLTDGVNGLLVDGVHDGPEQGFSPMPAFLKRQLAEHTGLFAHVNSALFTHLHKDHYQKDGVAELLRTLWPPKIYGPSMPETSAAVQPLQSGVYWVHLPGIQAFAVDTVHDGAQYRTDPHQSYFVSIGGETFFFAGDAALSPEDADVFSDIRTRGLTAGFFNLYQLASPQGQAFIRCLKPERVFLIHLPFREDDRYHYRSLARQIAKNLPGDIPKAEILPHMSWIDEKSAPYWNTTGKEKQINEDAFFRIAQQ